MEVVGSPDLVVEVVSRGSVSKDTRRLPPLYFAAGVDEFWLVDARGTEIDFQLCTRGETGWIAVPEDQDGYRHSPVLGGRFHLVRDRNPVGGSRYTLLAK